MHQEKYPLFRPAGDSALIIEFGADLDLKVNRAVQAFDASLRQRAPEGVTESAPTLRSVMVRFDPLVVRIDELKHLLMQMLVERDWSIDSPNNEFYCWRLPIYYGGDTGADLDEVASLLDLSVEETIQQHCSVVQRVLTLGFSPGFTYLGLLPEAWNLPRLTEVKPLVPAGSISVAVRQTVMTSTPIPTGWRTIGCTPFSNFNLQRDPPFNISAGDEIKFYPIDEDRFQELSQQVRQGASIVEPERLT